MNQTLLAAAGLLAILPGLAQGAAGACLAKTADQDLAHLSYATPYYLDLVGLPPMTPAQLGEANRFEVVDQASGKPVAVAKASFAGLALTSTADGQGLYDHARLYGAFKPSRIYALTVNGPAAPSQRVAVVGSAGLDAAEAPLSLFFDRWSVDLEPSVAAGSDLGLKYAAQFQLRGWAVGGAYQRFDLALESNGQLSDDLKNPAFQNCWSANLSLSYHDNLHLSERGQVVSNPLALRLLPLGIEADQDLSSVLFTPKAQLAFAVPYLDLPVLWLQRLSGVNAPFYPLVATLGYTHAQASSDHGQDPVLENRVDAEALYSFFAGPSLELAADWRASTDLTRFHDDIQVDAKVYLDEQRTKGFLISYQNGSLPPDFRFSSAFSVGWEARL